MLAGCPTWPDEFAEKYRKEGCWRGETFGGMLRERADKHGNRIAVTYGDAHISYGELDMRADRLAAGFLELGIKKEDRVIVQLPNTPEFFYRCAACICASFTSAKRNRLFLRICRSGCIHHS